jgi:hypothetical protein
MKPLLDMAVIFISVYPVVVIFLITFAELANQLRVISSNLVFVNIDKIGEIVYFL